MILNLFNLTIIFVLSLLPVLIWFELINKNNKDDKKILIIMFIIGILSVFPVILFFYLWKTYNIFDIVNQQAGQVAVAGTYISYLVFSMHGAAEETIKHFVIRNTDKSLISLRSINQSIKCSIGIALGFSFFENILYFYNAYSLYGTENLFFTFIFRSTVTMCGHLVFSSIFGYFYGVSKFSESIVEVKRALNQWKTFFYFCRKFNFDEILTLRISRIVQGISISIMYHAIFNFMLQIQHPSSGLLSVLLIFSGYVYVTKLLERNSDKIKLNVNYKSKSLLSKNKQTIILEIVSNFYKNKEYQNVIDTCKRALYKDPDNNSLKIIQTMALDKIK
jgi:RsiW-degrading membrane proteinase PrsW (M82 family)